MPRWKRKDNGSLYQKLSRLSCENVNVLRGRYGCCPAGFFFCFDERCEQPRQWGNKGGGLYFKQTSVFILTKINVPYVQVYTVRKNGWIGMIGLVRRADRLPGRSVIGGGNWSIVRCSVIGDRSWTINELKCCRWW